ncbi:MAG: hypothetical protein E7642_00185 [Ruminococcaceae bacterium]|nr:hypothetical protein [Oscillospiraceae bacterium]
MKRYLTVVLCLALLATLSSCSKKNGESKNEHRHVWGEWTVTKDSTCAEEGEAVRVCKCGDKQTHPIAKLAHTIDSKEVTPATCLSAGYTTYICKCGYSYKSGEIPAGNHTVSEWTTTKQGNCSEAGERTGTCTVCSQTVTETFSSDEHRYTTVTVPPTETEPGYTTFTCEFCGTAYNDYYTDPTGQPDQDQENN